MQLIKEAKRWQKLAGILNESINEDLTFDGIPEQVKQSYEGGQILSVVFVKKE